MNLGAQLGAMARGGVTSIRPAFYWSQAQPVSSFIFIAPSDAPRYTDVGGIPTDFTVTDTIVGTAARHGISVLPDVQQAPAWASRHPGNPASPPAGTAPYASFMAALATRYGPNGTFWKANPTCRSCRSATGRSGTSRTRPSTGPTSPSWPTTRRC